MTSFAAISARLLLVGSLSALCILPPLQAQRRDTALRAVSGHVVNAENQPLAKAVVYLKDTKSLAIRTYITQEDGSFRFSGLAQNVDYEVYADYEGARSQVKTLGVFDEHKQSDFTLKIKRTR
jgi:hypothetical protein